jgi:fatty-acyl-CoA synthase
MKARQGISQLLTDVRVMDEQMHEVPWDGKTVGEIVARGNNVMEGYYKQPEETAKAMRGGWFHSGDLAVVHPDGYIEVVDRAKDVIVSGGENISSVEVEALLYEHPAVLEAAVVGVPDPGGGRCRRPWWCSSQTSTPASRTSSGFVGTIWPTSRPQAG